MNKGTWFSKFILYIDGDIEAYTLTFWTILVIGLRV